MGRTLIAMLGLLGACDATTEGRATVTVDLTGRMSDRPESTLPTPLLDDVGDPALYPQLLLNVDAVKVRHTMGAPDDEDLCDDDHEGAWFTISEEPVVVDLYDGLGDEPAVLGVDPMEAGAVTEIRLVLNEEVQALLVLNETDAVEVTVPSGSSSGLKLKGCVPAPPDTTTSISIIMDLDDALRANGKGELKLHPTLQIGAVVYEEDDTAL